jgi:hypothetical protein
VAQKNLHPWRVKIAAAFAQQQLGSAELDDAFPVGASKLASLMTYRRQDEAEL